MISLDQIDELNYLANANQNLVDHEGRLNKAIVSHYNNNFYNNVLLYFEANEVRALTNPCIVQQYSVNPRFPGAVDMLLDKWGK